MATMFVNEVQFPIRVVFEDGETEYYEDTEDIELNLEHFDSDRILIAKFLIRATDLSGCALIF